MHCDATMRLQDLPRFRTEPAAMFAESNDGITRAAHLEVCVGNMLKYQAGRLALLIAHNV
jgi:hypothetical protein